MLAAAANPDAAQTAGISRNAVGEVAAMPENRTVEVRRLRDETAAAHAAVEGALPFLQPTLTLAEYRRALEQIFGVVAPWENFLSKQAGAVAQLAVPRARVALLEADLRALGSDPDALPRANLPDFPEAASIIGAMYVMEGSRLGGQSLSRHLSAHFGPVGENSTVYFRGFGAQTGAMWKEFVAFLGDKVPECDTDKVVAGAQTMFALFEDWVTASHPANPGMDIGRPSDGE